MPIYAGNAKAKLYIGNVKVKKAYLGSTLVYSSGNVVTYQVDSGTAYQEEVEDGASCLSPKTFTPAKSGWTFVGWRDDKTANGTVLTSKVMGDNPVTLYAVFRVAVTVTYYNNSTTASSTSGYRYYNNGNVVNPSFTLTQVAGSWTARGWSTSTAGNGAITYSNGVAFTRDSNITLYGMYQQSITLSYNGNGSTSGNTSSQTGTRYYNSNGNYVNPTFALAANGFTRTNATFRKWAVGSASGTQYAAGASITLSANTIMYALWSGVAMSLTWNARVGYSSYLRDYETSISTNNNYTDYKVCETAIDCSLYQGVTLQHYGVHCETAHEMTGTIMGLYETGGNFLQLVSCYREAGSVGGARHTTVLVPANTDATLTFAKSTGSVYLYVGFINYNNAKNYIYSNPHLWLKSLKLIPR